MDENVFCGQWYGEIINTLDSNSLDDSLEEHIGNCLCCSHYLLEYFKEIRKSKLKILGLKGEEADNFIKRMEEAMEDEEDYYTADFLNVTWH